MKSAIFFCPEFPNCGKFGSQRELTATNTRVRKEAECVDVIIVTGGEAKEIAALALELQKRQFQETKVLVDGEELASIREPLAERREG